MDHDRRPGDVFLWDHPNLRTIQPGNDAFSPPWRGAGAAYRLCSTCEQLDLEYLGYYFTPTSGVGVRLGGGLGWIRSHRHTCDLCATIWRSLPTPIDDASADCRLDETEVFLRVHRNTHLPAISSLHLNTTPTNPYALYAETGPLCQGCIFLLPKEAATEPRFTGEPPDGWFWVYLHEAATPRPNSHGLNGGDEVADDPPSSEPSNGALRDLATVVAGRALAPAHADETMSTIKDWLRVCLEEHHDCNTNAFHSVQHYTPPPRLIEISADGASAHLVEAAELGVPYVALSYCWGRQRVVTMTSSNYDAFRRRLPTEQLPRTIQQAIETTYRIGYHHLWVDSICIVQDNAEDWRRHTVLMGYIYHNAVLTIAATSAAEGSEGCFLPRPRAMGGPQSLYDQEVRVPCVLSGRYLGPMFITPGHKSWNHQHGSLVKDMRRSLWKDRAWVLQERYFTRRTVHFGASQTHWECRRCVKSQMFPTYELLRDDNEVDWQGLPVREGDGVPARVEVEEWWGRLVARYTKTNLSYPADRLPALAAITREAEESLGLSFVAGLCVETLPQSLLWGPVANRETELREPFRSQNPDELPDFAFVFIVPSAVYRTQGDVKRLTVGSRRPQDPPAVSSWSWAHWEGPVIPFVARGYFRSHMENISVLRRGHDQSHHQSVIFFSAQVRTVSLSPEEMTTQEASDIYLKSFRWRFSPYDTAGGWHPDDGLVLRAVLGPDNLDDEFVVLDDSSSVPADLCLVSVGTSVISSVECLYRIKLSLAIERAEVSQLVEAEDLPPGRYYRRLGIAMGISEMRLDTSEAHEKPRTIRQVVTGSRFQFAFGPFRRPSTRQTVALI